MKNTYQQTKDKAEVESLVDMQHIKLALQSYNFGNGYLSWAMEKDGGYTHANAIEFSEMMEKKLGWSDMEIQNMYLMCSDIIHLQEWHRE